MNPISKIRNQFLTDRVLVFIFSIIDLGLIIFARHYVQSLNELAARSIASSSSQADQDIIDELEKNAIAGSWEAFEKIRIEKTAYYLQSHLKPTPGHALYFFPETLSPQSFENDFAIQELKPGIEALRKAHENKRKSDADLAYRRLKSRVENYELGTSFDPAQLSNEAQQFLRLYYELTDLSKYPTQKN
jgi:hypothetical protein